MTLLHLVLVIGFFEELLQNFQLIQLLKAYFKPVILEFVELK